MTGTGRGGGREEKKKDDKVEAGRIKCNFLRRERLAIKTAAREMKQQRDEREEERVKPTRGTEGAWVGVGGGTGLGHGQR